MDYVSLIKSWKLNAVIKDRVKDYLVFGNSHQSCSIIKGVLKNFAKFRKTPVPETRFLLSTGYSHLVFFLDQLLGYLEKHVYGYEK